MSDVPKNIYNTSTKVSMSIAILFLFYMILFGESEDILRNVCFLVFLLAMFGFSAYKTHTFAQEEYESLKKPFVVFKMSDNLYYPTYGGKVIVDDRQSDTTFLLSEVSINSGYSSLEEAEGVCRMYYEKYIKPEVKNKVIGKYPIDVNSEPTIKS